MASESYTTAWNIVKSGLPAGLPYGVPPDVFNNIMNSGESLDSSMARYAQDIMPDALDALAAYEDEMEGLGIDVDLDNVYDRFEVISQINTDPFAEATKLYGSNLSDAELEELLREDPTLLDLAEAAEMLIEDPDDLDEFETLVNDVEAAMNKIPDKMVDEILAGMDDSNTFMDLEQRIADAERSIELHGIDNKYLKDWAYKPSIQDIEDELEMTQEETRYISRKTGYGGLTDEEKEILFGTGGGEIPEEPKPLPTGGNVDLKPKPQKVYMEHFKKEDLRAFMTGQKTGDGKPYVYGKQGIKGTARDAMDVHYFTMLFNEQAYEQLDKATYTLTESGEKKWGKDATIINGTAFSKAQMEYLKGILGDEDTVGSAMYRSKLELADFPGQPGWSPTTGETGTTSTGLNLKVTGAKESGLGRVYDALAPFFTVQEARKISEGEGYPRFEGDESGAFGYILGRYQQFAEELKLEYDAYSANFRPQFENDQKFDFYDFVNDTIRADIALTGDRDVQEQQRAAKNWFAWLMINANTGYLGRIAAQLDPGNDDAGDTLYNSIAWALYGKTKDAPTDAPVAPSITGGVSVAAIDHAPYLANTFSSLGKEFGWVVNGKLDIHKYASAKTGYFTPSALTEGSQYFLDILGAGRNERDSFDEAFRATNSNLMSNERDMVAWRDGIYNDAQMAKYLNYHPESRETIPVYKGYDPKLPDEERTGVEEERTGVESKFFFIDYINNRFENAETLYDNATELADMLNNYAWEARGEDYARDDVRVDEATEDQNKIIAEQFGLDLTDEDDLMTFGHLQAFNPLLYRANSEHYQQAENNILSMAVSSTLPVGSSPYKRRLHESEIGRKYDEWIRGNNNPNSFLKYIIDSGRIVWPGSSYYKEEYGQDWMNPYRRTPDRSAKGDVSNPLVDVKSTLQRGLSR